jgi:hypothetical protein
MKFISFTVLPLLLVSAAWGQDQEKPIEPPSPSVLYYLDSSGQLVPLESQMIRTQQQYRALGFAGGTTVYLVKGEKSPVRLRTEPQPEFVIRLGDNLDPLETVQFYHFKGENGSRVVPLRNFNGLAHLSNITEEAYAVDFNATKEGTSSFKLVPTRPLAPGEYCLMVRSTVQVATRDPGFCFGVDVAEKNEKKESQ